MEWSQASGRVYRKLRYLWRSCIDRQASSLSYEDVFEVRRNATQNQELMSVSFRAFSEYAPLPLRGKLVLFRARTPPLFHVCAKDYDWSQLVDSVAVISIPGTHDNLLQSPSVDAIATQLERLLGRRHHAKDDGPDVAHDKEPSV